MAVREATHKQPGAWPGGVISEDVSAWRRERLARAGFDEGVAARLAGDFAIDLHALLELVERGCRPDLAARILAPLDGESRPC
ncbi:MAG TPA: hypothetical protein VE523_00865 [Solirubrobacterales bacterium]|nr:hypothetical protein [Solirubrobacterales bacterium]